jgi:hypothetical protein
MPLALTTSMFVGMPGLPDHGPHLAGNIGTREWPIPRSHFRSLFPFPSQFVSQERNVEQKLHRQTQDLESSPSFRSGRGSRSTHTLEGDVQTIACKLLCH